jgi:hypothetical protein
VKNISTLVADIHEVIDEGVVEGARLDMGADITHSYGKQFGARKERKREDKTLFFSEISDPCVRRLWYKYHSPSIGEPLSATSRIKFMYGDVLESLVLQLAQDAGHSVTNKQEGVEYVHTDSGWRVRGRIDAIIDNVVVDVKSVTKFSVMKFEEGLKDDPFGYYGQLNGYATVLKSSDMGFLTIEKELGHIDYHPFKQDTEAFAHTFARGVRAVDADSPIASPLATVPQSKTSKNEKLCVTCSYCPYKKECHPDVRAFSYAGKVEWLTKVVDTPRVPEITT